tara:strand:+ start:64 stop:291 length:228 start_codon:yes stop_codon:yes gene_type:complete
MQIGDTPVIINLPTSGELMKLTEKITKLVAIYWSSNEDESKAWTVFVINQLISKTNDKSLMHLVNQINKHYSAQT